MRRDSASMPWAGHMLVATIGGRLLVFDGKTFTRWSSALADRPNERITAMHRLVDGSVAIAINGRGLFIVSAAGEIVSAFTSPEYHRIIDADGARGRRALGGNGKRRRKNSLRQRPHRLWPARRPADQLAAGRALEKPRRGRLR